jgi:sec-independent protein translocase protein TatC
MRIVSYLNYGASTFVGRGRRADSKVLSASNPSDYQRPQGESTDGEPPIEGTRMTFFEHLGELAQRLKKCLFAFIISFALVSALPDPTHPFGGTTSLFGYNFLLLSLLHRAEMATMGEKYTLLATGLMDPITVFINLSLVVAVMVALPYLFYQIYGFVAPGLYSREKKAVRKYLLPFTLLFVTGSIFGLLVIFPTIMRILLIFFNAFNLAPYVPLNDFVNLLLLVPALTGLAFTFPIFVLPLVEFKVVSVKQLSSARKWVYVVVALAVGIINPDPTFISSIPIVVPIFILYEVTVLLAKRVENKRNQAAALAAASMTNQPLA